MSHFPVRFAARISVAKAAKLLGISRNTLVRSWFKQRGIIKLQMSPTGRWFVETKELERVFRSRTQAGATVQFSQMLPCQQIGKKDSDQNIKKA